METLKDILNYMIINSDKGITVTVGDLLSVVGLLLAGYLLSKAIEWILAKRLEKTQLRPDAVHALKRVSFYTILIFVTVTTLALLGIPITAFAFATGAIAIGVGFGAQNIINNFISGWILIAERPIRIDDIIEVDGFYGIVRRVGTRSTLVNRLDGVHVLIPNSKLLENC